jgi:hypothetical protein
MSLIAIWLSAAPEGSASGRPALFAGHMPSGGFSGRQYGAACAARPARRYPGQPDRHRRHLQGRRADAAARQFARLVEIFDAEGASFVSVTHASAGDSHRARGQGGRGGSKSKSRIDAALEHLAARRTTTSCARRAGPAFGTSVMARPEEQLAPYRPSLRLLTPYIVARWPLRFCGPLLPCAEYPGLVKAASHQFHALLQSTWHCRRRAAMQRRARRWVVSCPYGGELT